MNPLASSIIFHAIGAASAALCYTPQKRIRGWSWQTFWLIQAAFCWFLLPVLGAFLTVPDYLAVVRGAPKDAMLRSFVLGMAYGVGGTAFGVALRYVGFSITYAMAIGISTVVGTGYAIAKGDTGLADAAVHIQEFLAKTGSPWVIAAIAVGIVGIVFCGLAGRGKERELAIPGAAGTGDRHMGIGLLLCAVAGVLSAVYGISLTEGAPIAKLAAEHAVGHKVLGIDAETFSSNAIYPFSNAGAFLTTALYCLYLHRKQHTFGEITTAPSGAGNTSLGLNWAMAILTGCLWYGQFFFYGFGHYFIMKVKGFEQTCWAIHMILLILLGTVAGVLFKEWRATSVRTRFLLATAIGLLSLGMVLLSYGNFLGQEVK
jgi:L-rhamnose-H+ transport protein